MNEHMPSLEEDKSELASPSTCHCFGQKEPGQSPKLKLKQMNKNDGVILEKLDSPPSDLD